MADRLKREPLWQVQAVVALEGEEAATEAMEASLGVAPVAFATPEGDTVELSVYLPARSKPARSRTAELRNQLRRVAGDASVLQLSRLADRDWRTSWKHHFRPFAVGSRLLLRPSWSRRRARTGQAVVVLDPGLSFGTGQHPTTRFCLQELVRRRVRGAPQSFLDLGTGSGILAIAAAKIGYEPIVALDNDPDCVRVALDNARRNRVLDRLTIRRGEVGRLPARPRRRHDVVCANLLAPLLATHAGDIATQVGPGGWLVVAGILAREFAAVNKPLTALGGVVAVERIQAGWHSATYQFPS